MTLDSKETKVIIVTGANKGIGKAIVKNAILRSGEYTTDNNAHRTVIYLTSRNKDLGEKAVSELKTELQGKMNGFDLQHHVLDICCKESISNLASHIKAIHGGLDILVNNAAIAIYPPNMDEKSISSTMATNYYATLSMMESFLPLMKKNGRMVNVSSDLGELWPLNETLRNRFLGCTSVSQVSELMEEFKASVMNGNHIEMGWPKLVSENEKINVIPYGVSKMGVTAITKVFADNFSKEKDLIARSCHPGYIITDMTKQQGELSVDEGAKTPLFLMFSPKEKVINATTKSQYDSGLGIFWKLNKPFKW